jgi:DNA-binding NtrC family response regulator
MGNGNLLIVDDEPLLVKRLKLNLEEYAEKIFTAENGLDAMHILSREEIHCVICDINMPKMNGVEVIKAIRAQNNNVPFIFYTGHGSQQLMLEAAKYGAFDFLDKPNLDCLEEVIARGLKEGFNRSKGMDDADKDFMSKYHTLLNELEKKTDK